MKLFYLTLNILFSLSISAHPSAIIHKLGVEQGLSNDYVISITQDKDGFLWFATEEGLNKFDGNRFIHYFKHSHGLSANELNCVLADPEEPIIWIATQRAGLNAYNYEENNIEVFKHKEEFVNSLITNDVTNICSSSDGNLWLSTYHRGIEYFNKTEKTFTHFNTSTLPELASDNIWTVMDDKNGNLYIGHVSNGMSILSLDNLQIKNFVHEPNKPNSIPGNEVRCIFKDKNNNIWVGTDKGLALFNTETGDFIRPDNFKEARLNSTIFDIRQTNDNKLWVATELNGVFVIDLKHHFFISPDHIRIEHYRLGYNKYSLSNSTVRCIYQDSFNNIWLGTYGGGINFIAHTSPLFNVFSYSPLSDDLYSINNRVALSVCIDSEDQLWIGTDGSGINVFNDGKRTHLFSKESGELSHNTIQSLYKDSYNNIWIGSFMGGINYYNHKTKQFRQILIDSKEDQDIRCFFEDDHNNMWVGTSTGIYVLEAKDQKVIAHYTMDNSNLPDNLVRCITKDNNGHIWIGTFGGGLSIYTENMDLLAHLDEQNGFNSNTINSLFKDSQGRIWVGSGDGLICFGDPSSFHYKIFQREEGLSNTYIRAITEDKEQNIWFSTNAGISCYITESGEFRHYNHLGRIPMRSFVSSVANDHSNGIIYFGSVNGLFFFDPSSVLKQVEVPPVLITEMEIFDTENAFKIDYFNNKNKQITLSYKQNTFSIFFNIQDFALADQVDFVYRIKGVDDTWQEVKNNNVTFRNMPPGHYEFQVSTHMKNQDWSKDFASLFVEITPPLWLTWWAKTLYVIAILAIAFIILNAYKKKLDIQNSYELEKKNHEQEQELNNERLRFYTNITHELRTPLTLILGPLEDLQKDSDLLPRQQHKISLVRQSALRLLNLINQLLEFRKAESQNKKLCVSKTNIAATVKEIGLKYKELNTNPNVEFLIEIENDYMPIFFDKEVIHIIMDNLISNAIKYTDKGKITLSLSSSEKELVSYTQISVSDTGFGIPENELEHIFEHYYQVKNNKKISGTGIGLALAKKLAKLHEGEIYVESTENKGSCFTLSLLTHNMYPNALHNEEIETEETIIEEHEPLDGSSSATQNGKPILLVVEDNIDIRDYISASFSDSFEVITATEGEEGLQAAFTHIPDIIVSDIMMPGMDGITFCRKVKDDMRTSHIPVILLTARTSLQDKEEGYISGADSYLTKPFSATLLRSRIHNLMDIRKKLAEQFKQNRKLNDKGAALRESLNQLDNDFLDNITKIIRENLETEKIDIGFLSDRLFMSGSTLYRKIKALTGISTNEFIRKVKMQHAEELLLTGKYTIAEVALRVGIDSPVYFRQCFKDEFGLPPSEYLKKIKLE